MFLLPVAHQSLGRFLHMPSESLCRCPVLGVGARRAGVLDEAVHGHMPASPVPGARCCAGERQERHLDASRGCHARSSPGPALQFPLPSLLRFLLEKQIFFLT